MDKIKVIFFDVNETLLDLTSMKASVGKALGGHEELLPYWFSKMLHYSVVSNHINQFYDFGTIGVTSLLMVAKERGIPLTEDEAKEAIVGPLLSLPAHSDVKESLEKLKSRPFKLVALTNSSMNGLEMQMKNSGLTSYFDDLLSIEEIKTYKPDSKVYLWACEKMGVPPEEAVLVAAHGWDVAGAKAAGLKAIFVERPGKVLYPLSIQPDHVVSDFHQLTQLF